MIRTFLTIILLINSELTLSDDSNFLIGSWVSDREATISYNKGKANWTEDQFKFFENNLGKLRVIFTEATVSLSFEEDLGENKYEVIELNGSSITIRSEISKEDQEFLKMGESFTDTKYYKDGKKIYVELKETKILLREYFKIVE